MFKKVILLVIYTSIIFIVGVLYVAYDIYHESLKVKGEAKEYYKAILISKYIKIFDPYALSATYMFKDGLQTLSKDERYSLYTELLINCDSLCDNSAEIGERVYMMIAKEREDFVKYLKNYLESNTDISKKDKNIISGWIKTLLGN